MSHTDHCTYPVCYWIVDECKILLHIYIVIECEIARWRHCIYLFEFCVTKTSDGWEEACEFDREVNCVDVCRLCTEYFS